ncbi:TPA: alpha/beta hydrolase [Streptococcus suis]|nr:alpha/beta hydrolase [Streptococcus suis]
MRIFYKILKWLGIVILGLVVIFVALYFYMDNKPDIGDNFRESVVAGGEVEKKYLEKGEYRTTRQTFSEESPINRYTIYYPEELKSSSKTYPLILVLNGTGGKASKYEPLFEHFASWGFVVIGTEDKNTGTGQTAKQTLAFMLEQDGNADSVFYQKIDRQNLGITGFSQGGASVFNVITDGDFQETFKAAVPLSPVSESMAKQATHYPYDSSNVKIPILVLAGTKGDFETKTVIPLSELNRLFEKIPSQKVIARRIDATHDHMLYSAAGYVTAWFRWHLQEDSEATKAFMGDSPELLNNQYYQDQRMDLGG